jgi:2-keto-4-pentenoate hydratase
VSDERVVRGVQRQLELRDRMLADGATRLGWKVGLNAPPVLEMLSLDAPLVGFLTDTTLLADGVDFTLPDGVEAVHVEPEIGVEIGADGRSIAALMPALELVHFDRPLDELEDVLAHDIFHRGVVLGPRGDGPATAARVLVDGEQIAEPTLAADLDEVVGIVVRRLADAGEALAPGDVIITGTLMPPPEIRAGMRMRLELDLLGTVEVGVRA